MRIANLCNPKFEQLRDYLTQLKSLSTQVPSITDKAIAKRLNVKVSNLRNVINGKTKYPKIILNNFRRLYPFEYHSWPPGKSQIGRVLSIADARKFFNTQEERPRAYMPYIHPVYVPLPSLPDIRLYTLQRPPILISPYYRQVQLPLPRLPLPMPVPPDGPLELAPIVNPIPGE
jgi:hypothetical protein